MIFRKWEKGLCQEGEETENGEDIGLSEEAADEGELKKFKFQFKVK